MKTIDAVDARSGEGVTLGKAVSCANALGEALYTRMQQPGFEDAIKRAFAASPAELGRAAVEAARSR